jgi:hypothetical protein
MSNKRHSAIRGDHLSQSRVCLSLNKRYHHRYVFDTSCSLNPLAFASKLIYSSQYSRLHGQRSIRLAVGVSRASLQELIEKVMRASFAGGRANPGNMCEENVRKQGK